MKRTSILFLSLILLLAALTGCGGQAGGLDAAGAIESYFRALVDKDAERLSTLSCAAWENDARVELESFGAVTAELENLACQAGDEDGETALVSCQGLIRANYGAEVLELDLAERNYQAVFENGEWRMCGYR